jgi:hypothetical protein
MTAGLESATAEEFLDATLNGDATLTTLVPSGAFNTQPPGATPYPIITFQFVSGVDYAAVGAYRIWANMLYLIKVIGDTANFADLNAAFARIDTLLQRSNGTAADGTVWSCVREQVIRLPDFIAGRQYTVTGAMYRLYCT